MAYDAQMGRLHQACGEVLEIVSHWEVGKRELPEGFNSWMSTFQALIERVRRDHPELERLPHVMLDEPQEPLTAAEVAYALEEEGPDGIDTVREWLISALGYLLDEREGFSGKRPMGNSDWGHYIDEAFKKHDVTSDDVCKYLEEVVLDAGSFVQKNREGE